jgi:hypothetical protein
MIYGIAGSIGSGKSHLQLKVALEMANQKEKQLVCNFPLNREGLKIYAKHMNYKWILRCLRLGGISEIHAPRKIEDLLFPESIVCLDEAGIFLNARDFQKTSKQLLIELCQSRKFGTDLVWCAQFLEQVDLQFRLLTQFWTYANSLTAYSQKLRRPQLIYKRYYWMDANSYFHWNGNAKAKMNHFKTRFAYSFRYEGGFLNKADRLLFNCFDSFTRLDAIHQSANIHTMYCCPLHVPNVRAVSDFGLYPIQNLQPAFERLESNKKILPPKDKQLEIPFDDSSPSSDLAKVLIFTKAYHKKSM